MCLINFAISAVLSGRTIEVGESSFSKAAKYEPALSVYSRLPGKDTFAGEMVDKDLQSMVWSGCEKGQEMERKRKI